MNLFLKNFFASTLSEDIVSLTGVLIFPLVVYLFYIVVSKIEKWCAIDEITSHDQLEFQKAKWDALESKKLLRMGAHVGWDGIGMDFEHDNRGKPRIDPLKMRLKRLRDLAQEGLITSKEYEQRKQEIIERI